MSMLVTVLFRPYSIADREDCLAIFDANSPEYGARTALCWIVLEPQSQGAGIGSAMMKRAMSSARASRSSVIEISTSQKSAPVFAKFGADTKAIAKDGWDFGLDRIDMELYL